MPLNIYTSNRMENLVEALARVLKQPLASPLAPEVIVTQSKGMQRWLAMELAGIFGVWANCKYPFPNRMIWELFCRILPNIPDTSPFSPEVMTWRIMGLLPGLLPRQEFAPLQHYLADGNGLKCFQLAQRIADTFDQYTLFRPELLLDWEAARETDKELGSDGAWQALLWRQMAAGEGGEHRGRLKAEFCRRMQTATPGDGRIPERIALFGISYLPQYHLDILAATARSSEVNLFLLSPSREYWADIVSAREKARLAPADRDMRSEGNPLLASLGRLGRDFSDMVIELGELASSQEDLYAEPGGTSLLRQLQADILNLAGDGTEPEKRTIRPDDRSVQIHSCHSPLREIEVLYDNILALLEQTDGLTPRQIVVMTPDIETYAPYIASVFAGCQEPARKIPYSIADRSLTSEGQIAAVVLKLLGLPGSRFTSIQLFDILEATPVSRRFELDDAELETIRGWLEETRIRWGMDEKDRLRLGLSGYRENSWRAGLDRLLLGYAMSDEDGRLFNGTLPYDELEGGDAQTLGNLAEFIARVAELADSLSRPCTLNAWRDRLQAMLNDFIAADDDTARELATIAALVATVGDLGEQAGFEAKVELDVIRAWLSSRLNQEEQGFGFLTGGVTFCAMLPMRSIPFRVVALIGMSDGAFPRQSRPPGFDLIARFPRRGDRLLRDEDRYLFLESILSARNCLYLSYTGQSIRDNSEIPPSVLVSEFLDAVERGFTTGTDGAIADRLVTRHRLQPFSRDYFREGSPLFSYSAENCAALLDQRSGPGEYPRFLATPLNAPADEWRDIPLAKLLRFIANPARFFLEQRMGIRLEAAGAPLEEREPFALDGLESYTLKNALLEIALRGDNPRDFLPAVRCLGILPPARHGELLFATAVSEVERFARVVAGKYGGTAPLAPIDFQIDLAGFRLTGRLDRIWPERMIRYRCARMKAKDLLRSWIEHLVLNAVRQPGYPCETALIMVGNERTFRPVEAAAAMLETILALYWQGLTEPLRFFPAAAMAYAHKQEWSLERARKAWNDGFTVKGEGDDPCYRLCFGQNDPFNYEFERIARSVLEPLLQHLV